MCREITTGRHGKGILLTCIYSLSKSLNYSVCAASPTDLSSRPTYHIACFSFFFMFVRGDDVFRRSRMEAWRPVTSGKWLRVLWLKRTDTSKQSAASTFSPEMQVAGSSQTSFISPATQPNIPDNRDNSDSMDTCLPGPGYPRCHLAPAVWTVPRYRPGCCGYRLPERRWRCRRLLALQCAKSARHFADQR